MQSNAPDVKSYLASLPADRRAAVRAVRDVIREHLPKGYVESMRYGMIVYEVPLSVEPVTYNKQPLSYAGLASQKQYMSCYVMACYFPPVMERLREGFRRAGKRLDMGKSCIRFKRLEDLPLDVIGEVIAAVPMKDYVAYVRTVHSPDARAKRSAARAKTGARAKPPARKVAKKAAKKKARKRR